MSTPKTNDDYTIIRRIIGGEINAFEVLIGRYREQVFRIVSGHVPPADVAMVAHDAFVRAYRSLQGYKPTRPFVRWLGTITIRTCHDFWRSRYRNKEIASSDMSEKSRDWMDATLVSDAPDPASAMVDKEAAERLHAALTKLAPTERMVLTLVHMEEYSAKEAAEMLNLSVTNVKVKAFRARKKLRAVLEQMDPQGGGAS